MPTAIRPAICSEIYKVQLKNVVQLNFVGSLSIRKEEEGINFRFSSLPLICKLSRVFSPIRHHQFSFDRARWKTEWEKPGGETNTAVSVLGGAVRPGSDP